MTPQSRGADYIFPKNFLFGVANAPGQVEDNLEDPWMQFGRDGKIKAFLNDVNAEERIRFWSEPDLEIDLASKLGVKIFRLGVSWQRIFPKRGKISFEALNRYKEILKKINEANMQIMLTFFHHSLPDWAIAMGGWTNKDLVLEFWNYSKLVVDVLGEHVAYYSTFNEPNIYAMFSYVAGIWPGPGQNPFAVLKFPFYKGDFFEALDNMALGHKQIYNYIHEKYPNASVGIAHNAANYKIGGIGGAFMRDWAWENMNWYFPDQLKGTMDFMGINYYGSEYMSFLGVVLHEDAEYNDAGRAIDPNGFYEMIKKYNSRYKLPVFITENGTADRMDIIRPAYIVEHLVALQAAIEEGIPVLGYIYWTLSDNLEWSDGYCPKFGLVNVDRTDNLARSPRQSYDYFQSIIAQNGFDSNFRQKIWDMYKQNIGREREMCRAEDGHTALDSPRVLLLKKIDWRFNK